MNEAPETIYLIPGEYDGERGLVWCDDPAPDEYSDPAEAVEYVRKDSLSELLARENESLRRELNKVRDKLEGWRERFRKTHPKHIEARQIIADLVGHAECNDPGSPHIARAKGFLSGGEG